MWYHEADGYVTLEIVARPNGGQNAVAGLHDGALKIRLKAPAVEGAANKELIKFLSKRLKVPKSEIVFVSGETSRRKRLRLPATERAMATIKEWHHAYTGGGG